MHSFTSCLVHCVWSTKNREPCLTSDLRDRVWPYLGGIAKQNQIKTLAIGGASDHVHILLSLPATLSLAKAMQLLKGNSSKWIRETFPKMHSFAWQEGYCAFKCQRFTSGRYGGLHSESGGESSNAILSRGVHCDAQKAWFCVR